MRLLIKQRIFSWSDTYDIYDEFQNVRYFVKAEVFTFGHQLHAYDALGNELGQINQKIFTFTPLIVRIKFFVPVGVYLRLAAANILSQAFSAQDIIKQGFCKKA